MPWGTQPYVHFEAQASSGAVKSGEAVPVPHVVHAKQPPQSSSATAQPTLGSSPATSGIGQRPRSAKPGRVPGAVYSMVLLDASARNQIRKK